MSNKKLLVVGHGGDQVGISAMTPVVLHASPARKCDTEILLCFAKAITTHLSAGNCLALTHVTFTCKINRTCILYPLLISEKFRLLLVID